jgi:hypothetical protein
MRIQSQTTTNVHEVHSSLLRDNFDVTITFGIDNKYLCLTEYGTTEAAKFDIAPNEHAIKTLNYTGDSKELTYQGKDISILLRENEEGISDEDYDAILTIKEEIIDSLLNNNHRFTISYLFTVDKETEKPHLIIDDYYIVNSEDEEIE